jgi:L-lactate permease
VEAARGLAFDSVAAGIVFALWPVMWIVFSALLLYNIAVISGRFDAFREWLLANLPNDRRVVLVVIGFCFGCLLEGMAGFGTPVAITSALLIMIGMPALEALTFTLIFNTAPVAFGALGTPITVLGQVTDCPPSSSARWSDVSCLSSRCSCPFTSWESTAEPNRSARSGRCCSWPGAVSRRRSSCPRTTSITR